MKKSLKHILSILICVTLTAALAFPVQAAEVSSIRMGSYKGNTLAVGERSGLILAPVGTEYTVTSSDPGTVAVEQVMGFWVAVGKAEGTAEIIAVDRAGARGSLTLTVGSDKDTAPSANEETADRQEDQDARQEIVRLVNQVRRENGAPELTVNAALMDAAQHCASLRVTYHQNKVECEAAAASGYPHGFGSNITAFANVPASETAERAVENWRNSPGHFQTMINPDCDTIGVGISTDEGGTICFLFVGDPNAHNPYA